MNAASFNARYPIGTLVFAYPGARPEDIPSARRLVTRTRTVAQQSASGDDVVWVDGEGSYIALTHVDPVTEAEWQTAKAAETAETTAPVEDTITNARQRIAALLWWSVPSSTNDEAKARTEELLDAYAAEAIGHAIARLRAVPVQCTALTGPVWYGAGWNDCITTLEDIADYRLPDGEAYPGELQRLRARMRELRAAALRSEDMPRVQEILTTHATYEADARSGGAPDFFQPGHAYASGTWQFRCEAITPSPGTGEPRALGWSYGPVHDVHGWYPPHWTPDDWKHGGWTDSTKGGAS